MKSSDIIAGLLTANHITPKMGEILYQFIRERNLLFVEYYNLMEAIREIVDLWENYDVNRKYAEGLNEKDNTIFTIFTLRIEMLFMEKTLKTEEEKQKMNWIMGWFMENKI